MTGQVNVHCPDEKRWLRFANPIEIVSARSPAEVMPALRRIEAQVRARRLYAAGYLAYQAAPAFDAALQVRSSSRVRQQHRDGISLLHNGSCFARAAQRSLHRVSRPRRVTVAMLRESASGRYRQTNVRCWDRVVRQGEGCGRVGERKRPVIQRKCAAEIAQLYG